MKKLMTACALAALIATPAMANSWTRHQAATDSSSANDTAGYGYDAYASTNGPYGYGPGVYSYGRYTGWDPDPGVRLQLQRDPIASGNNP